MNEINPVGILSLPHNKLEKARKLTGNIFKTTCCHIVSIY